MRSIAFLLLAWWGLALASASGARAATFTVNSTSDAGDSNSADGVCDTSILVGSQCTLRAALQSANVVAGADTIRFNIPTSDANFAGGVFTIKPSSALPTLAPGGAGEGNGTTLDGATQAAFAGNTNAAGPEIVLNGASAGLTDGLRITAARCVVKSLVINGFGLSGISISGSVATSNRVEACYLGTDDAGSAAVANGFDGVDIFSGAQSNIIGGTTSATRNVISGNLGDGVLLSGVGTKSNVVRGNLIGTSATGTAALPNQTNGVHLFNGPDGNVIGGTVAGARNVISGNLGSGVFCEGAATLNNLVQGNFIGTSPAGTAALANSSGVTMQNGAQNNTIGGSDATDGATDGVVKARNVISGNRFSGIIISGAGSDGNHVQGNHIGVNAAGTARLANGNSGITIGLANNTLIGGTVAGARNVISGNTGPGVNIASASGTQVKGNFIGTNAAGSGALGNSNGVSLGDEAQSNIVGGSVAAARNVISGNRSYGVEMRGANNTENTVLGNFIGTNAAGTASLGNTYGVVLFQGAHDNLIGGNTAGARNVISGNRGQGVWIIEDNTDNNLIQGNYIGTNAAGSAALGNGADGVEITDQPRNNLIGGTTAGARNVISGNTFSGVFLSACNETKVQGNFIGTNAAGSAALGNGFSGVEITNNASFSTIGGSVAGARNVISGNQENGVVMSGSSPIGPNTVQGNFIGTDATGATAIANNRVGVDIFRGVVQAFIGGAAAGQGNRIAFNRSGGVRVRDTSFAIEIRRNEIFSNGGLGINLQPGGEAANTPTPNDPGDGDSGPNTLHNFPVITSATVASGVTTVRGTFNSTADSAVAIELFRNTAAVGSDPSNFGEGQVYVGVKNVMTDASGNASFTFSVTGDFTGQFFTATATELFNTLSTSEFSRAVKAIAASTVQSPQSKVQSPVSLAGAEAFASGQSVQLTFSGALDAAAASDVKHYSVTVNGFVVASSDASYDATTNTVTLLLPDGALKDGDEVSLAWRDLPASGAVTVMAR